MRPGGGKAKGSAFEREVGSELSLWLSCGEKDDLFARTVLSGGQFTNANSTRGVPGDLMGASALGFSFLEYFVIECKHHRDIDLSGFLVKSSGSFLHKVWEKNEKDARKVKRRSLIIAKQNRIEPFVFIDGHTYELADKARYRICRMNWHLLHQGAIAMVSLSEWREGVKAKRFLELVKNAPPRD